MTDADQAAGRLGKLATADGGHMFLGRDKADLRAVLDDRQQLATRVTECRSTIKDLYARIAETEAQRDGLATKAQIFQDQRDGALSTMRMHGNALQALTDFERVMAPNHNGWNLVAYHAQQLRTAAGPDDTKDPE